MHPSARVGEADWLAGRRAPFGSYCVASIVTGGFPAYVRILHPARSMHGERLRWAEVAARSERSMHRLVQFHAINRPPVSQAEAGNLPPDLLRAACDVLAEHTSTPDHCWFGLWMGYGWLHDTDPACLSPLVAAVRQNIPCVHLPERDYLLLEGPLDAATELGWSFPGGGFAPQSPNLFWPDDHAWCVASEIDLVCTLVGGSNALAERLLADPRLEAWRVMPDDRVTADSDDQNT